MGEGNIKIFYFKLKETINCFEGLTIVFAKDKHDAIKKN